MARKLWAEAILGAHLKLKIAGIATFLGSELCLFAFRRKKLGRGLAGPPMSPNATSPTTPANTESMVQQLDRQKEEHRTKMDDMECKMNKMFEDKVRERREKLKELENQILESHERMKTELERRKRQLEDQRKQFEDEKARQQAPQRTSTMSKKKHKFGF
eukprot:m.86876 g.86876  ORF g.86876 m.86876 type:complete len:160 (+) comp21365_c0_seq2:751-1230(+)